MQYKAITLVKRPELTITPDLFETVTLETPDLEDGQFLLKQTHMSLDPAMRGWMTDDRNSYIPPVELGEIMRSSGVAEVVESKHEGFAVGDRVVGSAELPLQQMRPELRRLLLEQDLAEDVDGLLRGEGAATALGHSVGDREQVAEARTLRRRQAW